jgi:hypothetical protein
METEKPAPVSRQELEHNAEQGDGATLAAEDRNEKKRTHRKKA